MNFFCVCDNLVFHDFFSEVSWQQNLSMLDIFNCKKKFTTNHRFRQKCWHFWKFSVLIFTLIKFKLSSINFKWNSFKIKSCQIKSNNCSNSSQKLNMKFNNDFCLLFRQIYRKKYQFKFCTNLIIDTPRKLAIKPIKLIEFQLKIISTLLKLIS